MQIIARIRNAFPTKFGLPRQSGLVPELTSTIVFEPAFRVAEALRGIESYSHLWLIWEFHQAIREGDKQTWRPTVRPPRLGGNARMGVFATRSPFRPNPLGLTVVKLLSVEDTAEGKVLVVSGADLMDGTPIYDIKPYLPYVDSVPEALGGFTEETAGHRLAVDCSEEMLAQVPTAHRETLLGVLAQDPRPAYQQDENRIYGLPFAGLDVKFSVRNGTLTVVEITKEEDSHEHH
ncbi:MAG: tRNA (N6-threonylcarbamoyladenosine(37)-N6)-methyltransferase TrmO [Clostridia bacterium]|nr:tRNA (N6-threonylcarbamoyladenosine(37)-N6)-methyltransferase TrmO [Clostridia bacterium]MBQ7139531.1 tRNA (N6-threonylcarbamoyladenosine(37)-N6)-methyltransferase TrmO [Clostridia bacterium]